MKNIILIVFLSFLISFSPRRLEEEFTATCIEVIDGETIILVEYDKQHNYISLGRFQLVGLRTPDQSQTYFKEAQKFTEKLLLDKKVVVTRIGSKVIVKPLKGVVINELLVKAGLAWYDESSEYSVEEYQALEVTARKDKLGLWKENKTERPYIAERRRHKILKPFELAIEAIDADKLQQLLIKNPHVVNYKTSDNETPLNYALYKGFMFAPIKEELREEKLKSVRSMVAILLKNKAKIDRQNYRTACSVNDLQLLKMFFKAQPNLESSKRLGFTGMFHARSSKIMQLLIDNGADVNCKDVYGRTPIHGGSHSLSVDKILYGAGANIHAKDYSGMTPLHGRIYEKEVFSYLVEKGADINAKDNTGHTPLNWVLRSGFPREAKSQKEQEQTVKLLKFMIKKGAKLDILDESGGSIVHEAAISECQLAIPFLVSLGCEINRKNSQGLTPLDCAIKYNTHNKKMIQILIKHGAKPGKTAKQPK